MVHVRGDDMNGLTLAASASADTLDGQRERVCAVERQNDSVPVLRADQSAEAFAAPPHQGSRVLDFQIGPASRAGRDTVEPALGRWSDRRGLWPARCGVVEIASWARLAVHGGEYSRGVPEPHRWVGPMGDLLHSPLPAHGRDPGAAVGAKYMRHRSSLNVGDAGKCSDPRRGGRSG